MGIQRLFSQRERERERERENHLLINQGIFLREKNIWNCYNALFFNRVTIETLKKIELGCWRVIFVCLLSNNGFKELIGYALVQPWNFLRRENGSREEL